MIKFSKPKILVAPLITLTFLLGLYGCPAQQTTQQVVIQNVIKDSTGKTTDSSSKPNESTDVKSVATPSPEEEEINMTGTWLGSYTGITEFYMTATCTVTLVIKQSGTNLSGTASNTCSEINTSSPITGTIKDKTINIVDSYSGVEFSGILTDTREMQGAITGVMGTVIFYKN